MRDVAGIPWLHRLDLPGYARAPRLARRTLAPELERQSEQATTLYFQPERERRYLQVVC